jgi:superfamily II DNA or RNA helicase
VITIRPYISQWIKETQLQIGQDKDLILLQAPTGSGKTIYAGEMIKTLKNKRVLFLAPRRKLVFQTQDKFHKLGLTDTTLIMGGEAYNEKAKIAVGTIDSIVLKDYGDFDYIFVDEIHDGYDGKRMELLFSKYQDSVIIGLSATPIDAHGYLLEGFDCVVDSVSIKVMQEQGFSVQDIYEVPMTPDLSKCRIDPTSNEFNIDDITQVMDMAEVTKSAYDNWIEKAHGRKTMIFCTSIKHADHVRDYFVQQGRDVQIVHSKMKDDELSNNWQLFEKSGDCLINVDMATFGFDDEEVSCIILLRPIHSLRLYLQIVGRGFRTYPDKKDVLVLDFGGNFERHGLASDDRKYEFKRVFGRVIDGQLKLDDIEQRKKIEYLPVQKRIVLKRVGRLLDLYWDKTYPLEDDLLADVKRVLKALGYFFIRQNSGSTNMAGHGQPPRWVHFTDKAGLPDICLYFRNSSVYAGIELKSIKGSLNNNQLKTLPEMKSKGVLVYITRDIRELWAILNHLNSNIKETDDGLLIKRSVYNLWDSQYKLQKQLKLVE